jgi:hypothetical protein
MFCCDTLLQVDLSLEEVIFECKQHLSLNNLADLPDFSSFHEWFIAAVVYMLLQFRVLGYRPFFQNNIE